MFVSFYKDKGNRTGKTNFLVKIIKKFNVHLCLSSNKYD